MSIPHAFRGFVDQDGRISRLPVKWAKKRELADWLLELVEPAKSYTEPEINQLFAQYVDDFALLRRMLVRDRKLARHPYRRESRRAASV